MGEEYEVRVEGHLDERLRDWLGGMAIRREPSGETTLVGEVADQTALHGLLALIRDLNLRLVALRRLEPRGSRAGSTRASNGERKGEQR
jgi:hypothetical protein